MSTKFFVMSTVSMPHEDLVMPNWAPEDGAQSYAEAYETFAFDNEADAKAEAADEEAELSEAVSRGDVPDFDPLTVKKGELRDDGGIHFEDGSALTATAIYTHFGLDMPDFLPAPGV